MPHLHNNNILSEFQHGLREKRSCEYQLLLRVHDFAQGLNLSEEINSILLDFSKAFDKVDHNKLCHKLHHYGIQGKTLNWIQNFLSGRTQQVLLNGKSSATAKVISGVPQGTVLGPLLFLVYINDLPQCVKSKIRLFADDAYMYCTINTVKDTADLQNDLYELQAWEKKWSMEFHPDKCKVLCITNKTKPCIGNYTIHDKSLERVNQAKYLGVMLHKNLKWKPHVDMICKKANNTRNFLQRNLRGCSRSTKVKAYQTYVKPIINYASTVWNPVGYGNQRLRNQIKMIQPKSARFVFADWQWQASPTDMIKKLNWSSLESDRIRSNLLMIHKIIHNCIALLVSMLLKSSRNINTI